MIRDLDPTNDLTFLRIKTKQEEIMVTPDKDYMLIAIQGPRPKNEKKDEENWLYGRFFIFTHHLHRIPLIPV